ncbi:hypothetical protein EBU71_16505 [bacterium]|nr:hypothetical protein [Candidatus Elulimicrobium humile]
MLTSINTLSKTGGVKSVKPPSQMIHIPLEKSKEDAIEFIKYLKNHLAKYLDAGNPLESLTTTS